MRALDSRAPILMVCLIGFGTAGKAQGVCGDGAWGAVEHCGQDAYVVTGETEMNHDCIVDSLDFGLFKADFGTAGPSGDFSITGSVNLLDFVIFGSSYGNSVPGCTAELNSAPLCDGDSASPSYTGTIAVSLSSNPSTIVQSGAQAVGAHQAYVVVDGWTGPEVLEYGIETSSNVEITDHQPAAGLTTAPIVSQCFLDEQNSGLVLVREGNSWGPAPIVMAEIDYDLTDLNPAFIKLVPQPSCRAPHDVRWADHGFSQSIRFGTFLHVGINAAEPSATGCEDFASEVPALFPAGLVALTLLLTLFSICSLHLMKRREGRAVQ